jgi:hypothetical protein
LNARQISVPEDLRNLFWDVDMTSLDLQKHKAFVIERVLNMGDQHAVVWLRSVVSEEEIMEVVKTSRRLTRKTALCWKNILGLCEEEMRCFGTSSIQPGSTC